ncbi:hypothetical protein [Candidatus Parabeggiatoa sp. HSG14]|uniref:hypothetical protein n=1 Tax=Candidatus Parabeggiatoa sp. HSG14 TaxID=3055593 RepID=UPI0025A84FC8|nr:hypothetical protein [Thiotrichales bacterium HSG14]
MKTNLYDKTTLKGLRLSDWTTYLRTHGWQEAQRNDKATFWRQYQDNEAYEVLMPLRYDLADFSPRIREALDTLSIFEQRSSVAVLSDLKTVTSADVIRVCVQDNSNTSTIPLDDGVLLIQRARDMLTSAACATVNTRAYFASRKPSEVTNYLQQVSLGQTEPEGYVVKLISPVNPQLHYQSNNQLNLLAVEPPYQRRVVQTLMQSLSALQKAAEIASHSSDFTPFQNAVRQGVNANLCEAVIGMSGYHKTRNLEINVLWSYARTAEKAIPDRVSLSFETMDIIEEAGRLFRATSPQEDQQIEGLVISLHREKEKTTGLVTIMAFVDGRHRKVRAELDNKDYDKAIQAHKEHIPISCEGELIKEARSLILNHPRNFCLEPDE